MVHLAERRKARDSPRVSNYAIKVIEKTRIESDVRILQATIREINILRDVSHRNIVKLHEVYESKRHVYLVMQLVRGCTLEEMLLSGKPMKEDLVCQLMKKLLQTLKYMHSKGIVHHDLKPANVMVQKSANDDINPIIIDFGLANVMPSDGSKLYSSCGSVGYVAPELLAK